MQLKYLIDFIFHLSEYITDIRRVVLSSPDFEKDV